MVVGVKEAAIRHSRTQCKACRPCEQLSKRIICTWNVILDLLVRRAAHGRAMEPFVAVMLRIGNSTRHDPKSKPTGWRSHRTSAQSACNTDVSLLNSTCGCRLHEASKLLFSEQAKMLHVQFATTLRGLSAAQLCLPSRRRCTHGARVQFDGTAEDISDVLDRHTQKCNSTPSREQPPSTRTEALHLYRKILRCTLLFDWPDEVGELWRDRLRRSARQEFEASRLGQDAQLIARQLITSERAVDQLLERFLAKRRALEEAGQLPRFLTNPYAAQHDLLHPQHPTASAASRGSG